MENNTNNNTAKNKQIRYSKQRETIYEYLCSTKEHPSAEMIYEMLKPENPNLSLGTVYRNLKFLEEMKKIQRVTTVDNSERYDACCKNHAHFVCTKCGAVKDLTNIDLTHAANMCKADGVGNISTVSIVFSGTCEECI